MIELRHVSFRFSEQSDWILKDISLEIGRGEAFGLLGTSGSGKTVLLKLIAGLLEPTEGEILFQGSRALKNNEKSRREFAKLIGMSFQRGGLLDCFDVQENIDFVLRELTRLKKPQRREITEEILRKVGLQEAADFPLKSLSGGMLKRLSVARAMVLEPKILLLDEPTAGLDPITSADIVKLISDYRTEMGATVFFVTSDLSVAFLLGQRIGLLSEGQLQEEGEVSLFKKSPKKEVQYFLKGAN